MNFRKPLNPPKEHGKEGYALNKNVEENRGGIGWPYLQKVQRLRERLMI